MKKENICETNTMIEACHWCERLGFVLPDRQDKWWAIRVTEPINSLVDELKGYLAQTAIPAIERHLSDEQLCNEWLTGKSSGLTDIQRLINVSVLLKAAGAEDALREILKELEAKSEGEPTAFMVKQHLQHLQQGGSNDESQ